jgi:hypothetical protein
LAHGHGLAAPLERVFERIGDVPVRFFFEDAPGAGAASACERIVARFPECLRFAPPRPARPVASRLMALSNVDGFWEGAIAWASTENVSREILIGIVNGIPEDFPVGAACIVIGPVAWTDGDPMTEAAARPYAPGSPPFSVRAPALTYLAPGVIVQRLSSGTVNVSVTEQLPDSSADRAMPAAVESIVAALGAPASSRTIGVSEERQVAGPPPTPPADFMNIHARYRTVLHSLIQKLELPHQLPEPGAVTAHEPVGEIRAAIVRTFAADGWKRVKGRQGAGTHQLWKPTPNGRQLLLDFDTGSWLRFVLCIMKFLTERGAAKLPLHADASMRGQYLTPNPELFRQTLENLRVVVRHLERTWAKEMDDALGPPPESYRPLDL